MHCNVLAISTAHSSFCHQREETEGRKLVLRESVGQKCNVKFVPFPELFSFMGKGRKFFHL